MVASYIYAFVIKDEIGWIITLGVKNTRLTIPVYSFHA